MNTGNAKTQLPRLLFAIACFYLAGCSTNSVLSPNDAYRKGQPSETACQETLVAHCSDAVRRPLGTGNDAPYITHVEFDDQGALHNRELTRRAMEKLRERASQRPTLLVVFAHGWKHNADFGDENLVDFQRQLVNLRTKIATSSTVPKDKFQVEGVYLSWRGESWRPWWLKEFTFWKRKATAHRVGTDGAIEIFSELSALRSLTPKSGGRHALVVVGHSFGGALVYNATEHLLMRELIEAQQCVAPTQSKEPQLKIAPFATTDVLSTEGAPLPQRLCKQVPSSVADMVILVNPAFENTRFDPLEARSKQVPFAPGQMPIFAVFMSEKDWATQRLFPLGRYFSTAGNDYTSYAQRKRDVAALGHMQEKWTHTLSVPDLTLQSLNITDLTEATALVQVAQEIRPNLPGWNEYICGQKDSWSLKGVELKRYKNNPVDPYSPYMVVRVNGELIENHTRIWGDAFTSFVQNLVSSRFAGGSEMSCEGGVPARFN